MHHANVWAVALLGVLLAAADGGPLVSSSAPETGTGWRVSGAAVAPHPSYDADSDEDPRFLTSDRCLACHKGVATSKGVDVSIGYDWRGTMMANSARDPYWQAAVRRELIDHPEAAAAIEDK